MAPPDGSLSAGLGLSGGAPVSIPAYSGTPGPGAAPSPWKQKGATVFYEEGGVTSPFAVPGGTKGKGTYNAEGLFVNGVPVGVAGGGEPPIGPAGGDLSGSYPNPHIKPGGDNQIMATISGIAGWTNPPAIPGSLPPNGPAGGDLAGTYPNPALKPAATDGYLMTTVAGIAVWSAPPPATPVGNAGGDLSGTYPNPKLKPSATNSQVMTTVAGVSAWANLPAPPANLPPSGPASGDLAGTYPAPTIKPGVVLTGGAGVSQTWNAVGTVYTTFDIEVTDTAHAPASVILRARLNGLDKFLVDPFGNAVVSGGVFAQGSQFAQQSTAIPAGGLQDVGYLWSSTAHLGIIYGSGVPTCVMARGTWYQRTDVSTTNPALYFNVDGTAAGWVPFLAGTTVTAGPTPPVSPAANSLWFYTDAVNGGGVLYIFYNDGNSSQWVPCSPLPSATVIPPGSIMDFAGVAIPSGWLVCDGSLLSRTAYSGLFTALGTTYGAGDGSTTFALPDCRGRVTAGKEATATRLTTAGAGIDGSVLGAAGGTQTYALAVGDLASHQHAGVDHLHTMGDHTHGMADHNHQGAGGNQSVAYCNWGSFLWGTLGGPGNGVYGYGGVGLMDAARNVAYMSQTSGWVATAGADRSLTSGATGSGTAHQNTQPTIIMNKIIKT